MNKERLVPVLLVAIVLLAVSAAVAFGRGCPDFTQRTVQTDDRPLRVAYADTTEERVRGLSGCRAVPEGAGVYFAFTEVGRHSFWMKDMLMPIDIVWIKGQRIVGVTTNVPPPAPGLSEDFLPRYLPPEPVDAVLEVGAGAAARLGLAVDTYISTPQ